MISCIFMVSMTITPVPPLALLSIITSTVTTSFNSLMMFEPNSVSMTMMLSSFLVKYVI